MTQEELHNAAMLCDECECQECCEHYEHDHYICLDCGKELDPYTFIDASEYGLDP